VKSVSVIAPANIAFIKYWGRRDHRLYIPANNSISMTLSGCTTTTTASFSDNHLDQIIVTFHGQSSRELSPDSRKAKALFAQLTRLKQEAGINQGVRIESVNNFPADTGIASSASSFAAFTAAVLLLTGQKDKFDDRTELSRQIRLCGSGSAVRSAFGGFVEFIAGTDHLSSYAIELAPETHWDLVDIVCVVDEGKKKVSSSAGHELADTSAMYPSRLSELPDRLAQTRDAIATKNMDKLGVALEADCLSMFAVMMTSKPPIFYWLPGSLDIIHYVYRWRGEGLPVYFTFDAGPNPHLICEAKHAPEVLKQVQHLSSVKWTIVNHPAPGVLELNH
jgi:diphosphomevalonate decarboxylase